MKSGVADALFVVLGNSRSIYHRRNGGSRQLQFRSGCWSMFVGVYSSPALPLTIRHADAFPVRATGAYAKRRAVPRAVFSHVAMSSAAFPESMGQSGVCPHNVQRDLHESVRSAKSAPRSRCSLGRASTKRRWMALICVTGFHSASMAGWRLDHLRTAVGNCSSFRPRLRLIGRRRPSPACEWFRRSAGY